MAIELNKYYGWEPANISGGQSTSLVVKQWCKNQMFLAMSAVYGGGIVENYRPLAGPSGPMTIEVQYGLDGFTHDYNNADADREFDRIIMTDNSVHFAWNFLWAWSFGTRGQAVVSRAYWYFSPHPLRNYDYLGQTFAANFTDGYPGTVNTISVADPHPPPTLPGLPAN